MSNIYLVNPSEHGILDNAGDRIPLGLLSIATKMSEKHNVRVFDLNHTYEQTFLEEVEFGEPDVIGISVYTSALYDQCIDLAKKLKGNRLVAGGYHATAMPETLLDDFDAVVRGEGENALELALTQNGVIQADTPDLNNLPQIDRSFLPYDYGINGTQGTLITSRGCPYSCSFCGNMDRQVRFEPVWKVVEDIYDLKEDGFKSVYFLDDMFTLNKERMKLIAETCKLTDLPFRATTRANYLDNERLNILSENGCATISLGVESGNNQILKNINKRETTQEIESAVRRANERGIHSKGFFVIGLPGETKKTARQTIDFSIHLKDLGMTQADFYMLTPFPGTPIWNNPDKFGIEIIDKDFSKYLQVGKKARCVIQTKDLKPSEIEELVMEGNDLWKN